MNEKTKRTIALFVCALMLLTAAAPAFADDTPAPGATPTPSPTPSPTQSANPVADETPNTDIVVIPSNANALVLMDVGAQSPKGDPGDVVTIILPVAVNREYLPSERYMLRNITVSPAIPTDNSVKNWPFDLINASYTRHLDDMSYNSTAEIYYDFRISQFVVKGVYPVNFKVSATVWRYDDVNGTNIQEDVTFNLCVYVTLMSDGSASGTVTSFGPLQVAAANQSGVIESPIAKPKDTVKIRVPVINKGGALTDVTISPVISTSLDEFPFVAENINYGRYVPAWGSGAINYIEYTFRVSAYATSGNKPIKFLATYYENGAAAQCAFSTYIYITNGYEAAAQGLETAMSVMVSGYRLLVNDAEVSGLMAGDNAVLRLTIVNNAKSDTSLKNIASISLANSDSLMLAQGSSDAAYVSAIAPGETAELEFRITARRGAQVGPTAIGVTLNYETEQGVAGKAAQNIMIPVSQPMDVVVDSPTIYGAQNEGSPISVGLNIVNMGRAKALNLQIVALEGISMAQSYYGGDLLPGGTLGADIQVNPSKIGAFNGKLIVSYEDANGQRYTAEVIVPLNVAEAIPAIQSDVTPAPDAGESTNALPWWALTLIILGGLAAIVAAVFFFQKGRRV